MDDSPAGAPSPLGQELGFASLLLLFAASLVIVLAWLLQVTRGSPAPAPGARSLLRALCGFPSIRENWSKAWAQALNREAARSQSSLQMLFEENLPLQPNVHISHVTCTEHSESSMVLLCCLSADTVRFPVSVTQESPAAVSCDTYQVSLTIQQAQIEVQLQELPQEGLLVSWSFKERPDLLLQIEPKYLHQNDGGAELCTVQDLIQNTLLTAEPAMMFNLKTHDGDTGACNRLSASPSRTEGCKLLIRQLRLQDVFLPDTDVELMCEAELDNPGQRKNTRSVRVQKKGQIHNVSWSEEMTFDLTPQSTELSLKVWQILRSADNVLLGHAVVAVGSSNKELCGRHLYPLIPSSLLSKVTAPAISVEFHFPDVSLTRATLDTSAQRFNITPTKKVEMDRTVMPDGTIVTTVTTIQSRLKLDGRIDSPASSPSKVEVTENKPVILPRSCSPGSSPSGSGGSPTSIKLDPVAETAIRQLTEPSNKSAKRTPTKRSTLIISGVSKVPVGEDEMALSLGYAASMDATLQGTSTCFQESILDASSSSYFPTDVTTALSQDADDTTRSDISDRPSLDELDSDMGSTGALETRSLKDHKVGFLRSGTKLLFRWHHRSAGLSQSHDDLTNSSTSARKKSGSFSRRLLKRFSLKSRSKPSVNGGAKAGDK